MKRFLAVLLIGTVCFLAGMLVGKFAMSRKIVINVVDVKELVEVIERYNEAKYEFERIKEWNKDTILPDFELEPKKEKR